MSANPHRTIAAHPSTLTPAGAGRKVSIAPYLILVLALAGVADAFYVASASYLGQPLREFLI